MSPSNFYTVIPFIKELQAYVSKHHNKQGPKVNKHGLIHLLNQILCFIHQKYFLFFFFWIFLPYIAIYQKRNVSDGCFLEIEGFGVVLFLVLSIEVAPHFLFTVNGWYKY